MFKILPESNFQPGQKCLEWCLSPIAVNMALSEDPTIRKALACKTCPDPRPPPSHFALHVRQQNKDPQTV